MQVVRGQNWRWNKNYHLIGSDGRKHEVWKVSRGKRSWEYRMIWDARRRCQRKTGVIAPPIHLPDDDHQLFLVVSRPGYGRKPWYLIITEPVYTAEQACRSSLPMPDVGRLKCPFQILPQNWKVEPRRYAVSSTLSFTSRSFTPLAPYPPSSPPYIHFGVNYVDEA